MHLMIDLETMGTAHDAPILSVGAVIFAPQTGVIGPRFYGAVSPASALAYGRLSGDTLKWWMAQGDAARTAAMAGTSTLEEVLYFLGDFCVRTGVDRVWGNGATFDITILEVAYAKLDQRVPWGFRGVRDCRTINELAEGLVADTPRPTSLVGHNALDDAVYQAMWVSAAWQALRPAA